MPSWFQIYQHRREQLTRYRLPSGSEGSDSSTTYFYPHPWLLRYWFWWRMFILVVDIYYLYECCLWMSFHSFYYYSIQQLLPLNIILMLILLTHLVFKIMMTPVLPPMLFQFLGSKSKRLLYLQHILGYDFNGLNILIYLLFLISYFLPYYEGAWLHLIYTFKLIEINGYLNIVHTKIHTSKLLRVFYRLTMLMFLILYLSHLFAAIFYFIDQTMINQQYFGSPSTNPALYYQFNAASFTPIEMLKEYQRYIMAFYFSNGLVTTIAYGDIVGENYIEDAFVAVLMVASTVMVAFLLQQFMIMVEDNRFAIYDIIRNYRHLQNLMQQKKVPEGLQLRIRNFIFYSEYYNKFRNPATILCKLTNKIKIDLFQKGYGKHLSLVFQPLGFSKVKLICKKIEEITFQPEIDLFLPQWKQQQIHTRECTCENEVNMPSFMFLTKGRIEHYLQWDHKSKQFILKDNDAYVNTFQFFTKTHVRYGVRTKTIVQFIRLTQEAFRELLEEYPKFKTQLCTLKEKIMGNCASRKFFLDACEVCEDDDHSIVKCPQVHYVVDESIRRAQKIQFCLDRFQNKRGKKQRKNTSSKKVIGVAHYAALFANLSLEAMFQEPVSKVQPNLDMGASYLQKTIKNLYEKAHIAEHDHDNHDTLLDTVYDPFSLDEKYRIDHS